MTVHASITFKHSPARDGGRVFDCGLLLRTHPGGKIFRSIYRNAEQHLGVLYSAILCTLTNEDSCALRVHPHSVGMVGDEVCFTGELRHPKAVGGVGREQLQERRCRMI